MRSYFLLLALALATSLSGQYTGHVNDPTEGISFDIPANWAGQEMEDLFLMSSGEEPGLMALMFHPASSLAMLKEQMKQGLRDASVNLSLIGDLQNINAEQIAGNYQGFLEGQAVKGRAIALLNPHGKGLVVLSLINDHLYTKRTEELAGQVAASIRFAQPIQPPANTGGRVLSAVQAQQDLANSKLKYLEAYYSDTPGGGGYERRKEINLCPGGVFTFYGSSYLNVANPDVDPYRKSGNGHGKYSFVEEGGKVYLELQYTDGHTVYLHVTYQGTKTFLDGGRYYVLEVDCY